VNFSKINSGNRSQDYYSQRSQCRLTEFTILLFLNLIFSTPTQGRKHLLTVPIEVIKMIFSIHSTNRNTLILPVITGLQINLYLERPMEIQLFATFFQRRK
jgi:hypothetical protein